ncbi:MAG TPA: alpha-2-macroglobulin family protein, partial [Candidatus Tumulicola sp.]|nr:alpha-2-macroglobulin family protein [Candidatus Tumulicola sp.]
SDRLLRFRVVHLTGTAVTLEEPAPPDAARFTVSVAQADESGGSSDVALLTVDPPPHRLVVHVAASKARYAPGEVAQLRVDVRDSKGKPVRAEVGLGVVDEAIYALEEDRYVPFDAFYGYAAEAFAYGNWSTTVQPYFPRLRTIAYVSARAAVPPPRTSATSDAYGVRVRRNFLDTAFWAPSVITNARGHATVSFVWPDDLTTWRATGTAVTTATDVGTGTADALVTKDFLVRLATPRFLRVGDESSIVGIAQGRASHPSATLRLQANAPLSGTPSQRVTLDANGMASAAWRVRAGAIGSVLTTLYGSDGALSDAMQTRLPVEGATSEEHVFGAGSGNGRAQLSIPPGYGAGALTVTIAPSLLAQLMQSLHLLQVYPYDCTEQTLSAALPALFVERALEREHATADFPLHWRDIGYKALRRLNQLQHPDGSYGWWEHDAAHPFMTAYALYGLAELGKAGFSVDDQKTITNLIDQLQTSNDDTLRFWGGRQPGSEWNTRAFMLFALADAAPGRVPAEMLAEARAHATSMNAYALAVLGLAEHTVGDDASARQLLAALDARVSDDGTFAYWRGQTWEYAWEDDPIETTAYALRLQTALDPENPLTPRVVAFLRAQLRGGWAYTTKDTAATIYALSETQPMDAHELHPDETVRVALDGRIVRAIRVTAPVLDAGDAEVLVPADQIRDGSIVSVTGSGRGTFYWSTDLTRYVPPTARTAVDKETPLLERLFPPRPDVTISRRYIPQRPGPWRVGERVEVEVTVTSRRDLQYVAVDDPFPAGAEHPIDQGMAGADAWSRLQFLDDRASFFVQQLPAGQALQLHYALDLTTAGRYAAPPPALTSMYGPPVRVLGEAQTVTIDP